MPEETPSTNTPPDEKKNDYAKSILSPKNIIIYLVAAVIIYAGVYYYFFAMNKKSAEVVALPSPQVQAPNDENQSLSGNQMIIELKAQNESGQEGLALLTEENGKTKVEINTTGGSGGIQPAHIHEGACPTPGSVKWPLANVANGSSSTTISATLVEVRAALPLAVNIHKSSSQLTTYVACGDVK